jgi:hypothetical protein
VALSESAGENKKNIRKSFFTGSNSTCRQHIRQHYEFYSQKCKEKGIEESERCVPIPVLQARKEAAKRQGQVMVQTRVDEIFDAHNGTSKALKAFNRAGILKAVTVHIATDDQASAPPTSRWRD